jgi:hypothetical protein
MDSPRREKPKNVIKQISFRFFCRFCGRFLEQLFCRNIRNAIKPKTNVQKTENICWCGSVVKRFRHGLLERIFVMFFVDSPYRETLKNELNLFYVFFWSITNIYQMYGGGFVNFVLPAPHKTTHRPEKQISGPPRTSAISLTYLPTYWKTNLFFF